MCMTAPSCVDYLMKNSLSKRDRQAFGFSSNDDEKATQRRLPPRPQLGFISTTTKRGSHSSPLAPTTYHNEPGINNSQSSSNHHSNNVNDNSSSSKSQQLLGYEISPQRPVSAIKKSRKGQPHLPWYQQYQQQHHPQHHHCGPSLPSSSSSSPTLSPTKSHSCSSVITEVTSALQAPYSKGSVLFCTT